MKRTYAWGDHLFTKYESLWSILHKFADLNIINHKELYQELGDPRAQQCPPRAEWSLNQFNRFSPKQISFKLNIDPDELRFATIDEYKIDFKPFSQHCTLYLSNNLRYCPQCIRLGFHTPLFQYEYVKECPIHNEPLTERCANCQSTNKYAVVKSALDTPYCCSNCRVSYYRNEDYTYKSDKAKVSVTAIDSYYSWKNNFEKDLIIENLAIEIFRPARADHLLDDNRRALLLTSIPSFKNLSESVIMRGGGKSKLV